MLNGKLKLIRPLLWMIFLSGIVIAQGNEPFYYHTIHSHGLSLSGGRTAKVNYLYQTSHGRQFKLSGNYVFDAYDQDLNRIESKIYNGNLQYQFNLLHKSKFFLHAVLGAGGYYLKAQDLLNIEYTEWKINFLVGAQAEIYLVRNKIALTVDYDFMYMPWSGIYDFLHLPNAGLTFFFF